jgi:hypothetical protein
MNRVDYAFEAIKTSALVEGETGVILEFDCTKKQPHDTQIGAQVLAKNVDRA